MDNKNTGVLLYMVRGSIKLKLYSGTSCFESIVSSYTLLVEHLFATKLHEYLMWYLLFQEKGVTSLTKDTLAQAPKNNTTFQSKGN